MRLPFWYINPIVSLIAPTAPTNKEIPLKSSNLEAKIQNSTVSIKYSQTFVNSEENPLECLYKFPADPYFSVTGMHITLEDREIDAVIMEKEEAKELYDDAVAAGHTAAKINYDENIPEIIELAIGAIQKGKVKIDVYMVAKCDVIKHGFYSFIFPVNFIPRYDPTRTTLDQPKVGGDRIPGNFSCSITVEASAAISDLSVSHKGMTFVQSEDGKQVTVKLEKAKDVLAKDIVVSYSTETIRQPSISLHACDKYQDEVAAHISFIPRVSDEHGVEDSEETKEEQPTELNDVDDKDDPDVASGEFIFILDRSGSMGGTRITTAIEALSLFIQSLPSDCKFNIVSFGGKFEFMYKTSQKYEKKAIDQTLTKLKYFKANMGGTNMLDPIVAITSLKHNYKYPRNVFILTDGAISNTDTVVNKIKEYNYCTRVHTFGIGSGASAYLVKETAKAGLGTSAMIPDNDPKIKEKIIQALKMASKPAFTDIKVDWKENNGALDFQCPRAPVSRYIYEEESLDIYAIFKKSALVESELELCFFNTFTQSKDSIVLKVDPALTITSQDDSVFKLAAKENLVHYKRTTDPEEIANTTSSSLALSLKYSVLSDQTAFFGKIKNKEKSTLEMKTITIPIRKMRDFAILQRPGSGMYRGRIGGIMRKCGGMARGSRQMDTMMLSKAECAAPIKGMMVNSAASLFTMSNAIKGSAAPEMRARKAVKKSSKANEKCKSEKEVKEKFESRDLMRHVEELGVDDEDECDIMAESTQSCVIPTADYQKVVSFQEPQGYFKALPSKYKDLVAASIPEELKAIISDEKMIAFIWTTIVALYVLEKDYQASKGEWTMIAKKAKTFLKKNGIKDFKQFANF
mmetsp:Transcript_15510/g.17982  ORF Transcript_15510/g.17982 Transcript_15510/m.17982 type:complete len:858 (-) Transcript_15510:20-2593(-)